MRIERASKRQHHPSLSTISRKILQPVTRYETDAKVDPEVMTPSTASLGRRGAILASVARNHAIIRAQHCSHYYLPLVQIENEKIGQHVPLALILEVKTRASHKTIPFDEVAAQLWIFQTCKLVVAYHKNRFFRSSPSLVEDVATNIKDCETCFQDDLRILAALVRKIVSLTKQFGTRATLKYDAYKDILVVSRAEANDMLQQDLYARWGDSHDFDAETVTENEVIREPQSFQFERSGTGIFCPTI